MSELQKGIYKHYKGKDYRVLGKALHTETEEELVVYKPLYDIKELPPDILFVRPLEMFLEEVEVNGEKVPRFRFINNL